MKIISGCQTGADIAGVDAAIANSFPYGGWVSKGRKTEIGPLPPCYNVNEMTTGGYFKRTKQNVIDSDGTAIFTHGELSGGSDLTRKLAIKHGKPWIHINMVNEDIASAVSKLRWWLEDNGIETLNIAGKTASKDEKIYNAVFQVVDHMLRQGNAE
jgi:hypothetical protein